MKFKHIILLFAIMMLLVVPSLAVSQTVSFTQDGVWTCPSDVTMVSIKMVGGGGGGVGGWYWLIDGPGGFYAWGNGAGGNNGTYVSQTNIPVVPGQTYSIVVGAPGVGVDGKHLYNTSTRLYYYGNPGGNSSVFGYTAAGGTASYVSWIYIGSSLIQVTYGHGFIGSDGYGNYQIASPGANGIAGYDSLFTSYGSLGGVGYGAGGGAGGAGSPTGILGGAGGNGAYGYVEIIYDSDSTNVIPTGYVIDAYTSSVISGAVINVTQSGSAYIVSSGADGSFNMDNAPLTYGVPITITTSKSGYADDINTFTPLASGPINLTVPLIATSYYTNTQIVGIVRDSLYGNPISGATYSAQSINTSSIYTATSNINGFADVTGLSATHLYLVWANKTGYTSPSPVLAKTYS